MPWIVLAAIGLWFLIGTPSKTFANWFWTDDAAPWETVDAFYYPDRQDLTNSLSLRGLKSVQECRDWVFASAALQDDPNLIRGDYECGVEQLDTFGGLSVYRLTVR